MLIQILCHFQNMNKCPLLCMSLSARMFTLRSRTNLSLSSFLTLHLQGERKASMEALPHLLIQSQFLPLAFLYALPFSGTSLLDPPPPSKHAACHSLGGFLVTTTLPSWGWFFQLPHSPPWRPSLCRLSYTWI